MPSFSEENYLKAIYHLSQPEGKVGLKAIADALGNRPASVIEMVKKLKAQKLLQYDKKKGALLTEQGKKMAISIIRKHRLWEVFLNEKLGYSWDEVHDIAEQLEHIKQNDLADRLDKFLGYPGFDPHGDPIPSSNGKIPQVSKIHLSDAEPAKIYQVVAVKDADKHFLQYLGRLKIGIGTKLRIIEKISFDDSLNINIGKSGKALVSKKFSDNILVVPA